MSRRAVAAHTWIQTSKPKTADEKIIITVVYSCPTELVIGFPFFVSLVSMRVYITELLDLEDVPVFMALLASIEKLVPLASGALVSTVFYVTRDTFPGFAYLIVTMVYVIPLILGV